MGRVLYCEDTAFEHSVCYNKDAAVSPARLVRGLSTACGACVTSMTRQGTPQPDLPCQLCKARV